MENIPQTPAVGEKKKIHKAIRQYAFGAAGACVVFLVFLSGVFFGQYQTKKTLQNQGAIEGKVLHQQSSSPSALKDVDFQAFWDIWKIVKERHVEQAVSDKKLFYGAIAGMVGSLQDPYSVFFDPEFAQKFSKELEGTFDGIGAEIGIKQNEVTVIAPLPGTPASSAGIKAGDRILAIDGIDTTGMLIEEAVTRIRGQKGTQVKLLVFREGFKTPKEFLITRETITVESVTWKMDAVGKKKIAHITITHFNETTEARFSEAVRSLLLENPDGLVLDLRNNPGGFLDTAVKVAGEWIVHDVVVIENFSDNTKKNYNSDGNARLLDVPTIVLVNGGSASASEIVAGALQDYGKAKLVGEKTYGKGSVQDYSEFSDGSALKLTVALWLTPKGRSINKEGIAPDVEVKMSTEDFNNDKDPQLEKAYQLLINPQGSRDSASAKVK